MNNHPVYYTQDVLGKGTFGVVYKAIEADTKNQIALKRIVKNEGTYSREFEIMNKLQDSKHVVKILNFFYTKNEGTGTIVQNISLEFLSQDLEKMIQKRQTCDTRTAKFIFYQILLGLDECHSKNVMHRDLKPDNIMLDDNNIVKINDFGCSKISVPGQKNTPYVVARSYRAPELILGDNTYDTKIDIFSAGSILADMVTGVRFFGQSQSEG